MMHRCNPWISVIAVVSVCLLCSTGVDAALIVSKRQSGIDSGRALWKPSRIVQFNEDVFCFVAVDGECFEERCPEHVTCSFDKGESFSIVTPKLPYCADRGVQVDGQLYCPYEQVDSKDKKTLLFSSISFTPLTSSLDGVVLEDKQHSFHVKDRKGFSAKSIRFTGNALFDVEIRKYVMVATLVGDDNVEVPAAFTSSDGFSWTQMAELPLSHGFFLRVIQPRSGLLSVFSKLEFGFETVSSKYGGKYWSGVRYTNTTAPPFAFTYPSGLVVEYGMSNSTDLSFQSSVPGTLQKNSTSLHHDDALRKTSSAYVAASQPSPSELTLVYDAVENGKGRLYMSSWVVDDSHEAKVKAEKEEKLAKKKAREEEARLKATLEKIERQKEERRKRIEKERERKARFAESDVPHIVAARESMKYDQEFIVVRHSSKDTIEFEKESFFEWA